MLRIEQVIYIYINMILFQYGSGADLSLLLVDTLEHSCSPVTTETIGRFLFDRCADVQYGRVQFRMVSVE